MIYTKGLHPVATIADAVMPITARTQSRIRRFTRDVALLPYGGLPAIELATVDESLDFLRSLPSLAMLRASPERHREKDSPKATMTVVLMADGATTERRDPLWVIFLGPRTV